LNKFCTTCQHLEVSVILKEKYNKYISKTFIECPFDDIYIAGCLIGRINIKWSHFYKWLVDKGGLTANEQSILETEGW